MACHYPQDPADGLAPVVVGGEYADRRWSGSFFYRLASYNATTGQCLLNRFGPYWAGSVWMSIGELQSRLRHRPGGYRERPT